MTCKRENRTLIYKMTHTGDPDPETGVFGNMDCMGQVRGWSFDAVIGVGGTGHEARRNGIDRKLVWIGIGPHRRQMAGRRGPLVTFDHFRFLHDGEKERPLDTEAPALARRIYDRNVRQVRDALLDEERAEVERILGTARHAPRSGQRAGVPQPDSKQMGRRCRSRFCRGTFVAGKDEHENPANRGEQCC